ncbi:Polyketide synthase enoylreductase [Penicillium chermesinum]|uniref:Polyketide synthase enoylreductase n=1 Tax=Penicillium chermesinum TaxID=63820 RepID=A0A9W9PLW4_9EURO|nr:Polyketide synthase enoylreductase [Penicillium chermesinum]KAJ5249149.1 Polyketide synthase enoylreductase [Penicillium chermesinum]
MATQKAITITAPGVASVVNDRRRPALRPEYLLIKVVSVGLNPTDWKHIKYIAKPGVLVGCDYAGIVEEVGAAVTKRFQKGDRVCGMTHGSNDSNHDDGAFAEYIVAKAHAQWKIPPNLSFEEAATLGVGVVTVGQSLYQALKLDAPRAEPVANGIPLLIYGGSTATGTLAIQFAKLSGYTVYTTCSPRNFELVKGLGADEVLDYRDAAAAAAIREKTGTSWRWRWTALRMRGVRRSRENIVDSATLGYTAMGEAFTKFGKDFPAKPEDAACIKEFIEMAEPLLAAGKVKVHPPKVGKGGLQGVLEGLKLLEEGKVSGEKLVYNIADTA